MIIRFGLNGIEKELSVSPSETLLQVLRREGLLSVKSGGCQHGECGACAILLDGELVNTCSMLAAQVDGHALRTVEAEGEHPQHGWRKSLGLSVIQQAFVETGAIQCGYCTPAMVMAALSLLEKNERPTEIDRKSVV